MIPFLECAIPFTSFMIITTFLRPPPKKAIAIYKPADVRPILQAYADKNIPLEYAKKEAEAKAKHVEEWQGKKGMSSRSFSSMFGLSSGVSNSLIP